MLLALAFSLKSGLIFGYLHIISSWISNRISNLTCPKLSRDLLLPLNLQLPTRPLGVSSGIVSGHVVVALLWLT